MMQLFDALGRRSTLSSNHRMIDNLLLGFTRGVRGRLLGDLHGALGLDDGLLLELRNRLSALVHGVSVLNTATDSSASGGRHFEI